tara:strand:+ start:129 stop:701 length:573 start_codon:yes stop_codon:yes gene_type:complete
MGRCGGRDALPRHWEDTVKHTIAPLGALTGLAIALAGCASTAPEPEAPAAEPVYMSDAEFKTLSDAAYFSKPPKASEQAYAELFARDDLTVKQRASLYRLRGATRGIFVRDWDMAYPQCAVVEYREMEKLMPDHPDINTMKKDREYQFYRFQYFPNAPESCKAAAEIYRQEIGDCLGLRDENGTCIIAWK